MVKQQIITNDGQLDYYPQWLDQTHAEQLMFIFVHALQWQQETIKMFGREHLSPRLVCWYGDDGVSYRYSGVDHVAKGWHTDLLLLRNRLKMQLSAEFNSVLGNYYRDGNDYMGWHSDNEKALGMNPVIASLSLGVTRRFSLQHKTSKQKFKLDLNSGDLLVMAGELQHHWRHALLKSKLITAPRINLTFRRIIQF